MDKTGVQSVTAHSVTVRRTLNAHTPMVVPRYQRGYAWGPPAIKEYIDDIEAMMRSGDPNASHFFGSIVYLLDVDSHRAETNTYEVVDGQQRLATSMLTLSCLVGVADELRDECEDDSDLHAELLAFRSEIQNDLLCWVEEDEARGLRVERPRLTLSLADAETFSAIIMREELPDGEQRESQQLLVAARDSLNEMVHSALEGAESLSDRVERLRTLRYYVAERSHLIRIVSEGRSQSYRLFSILNDRGRPLSTADLLRNRYLELVMDFPSEHEAVAKAWDGMFAQPVRKIDAFLWAYYPSRFGKRALRGTLFDVFDEHVVPPKATSQTAARGVARAVRELASELDTYTQLTRGEWPFPDPSTGKNAVSDWSRTRLTRLLGPVKHRLALPLLLAAARSLSEEEFAEIVFMLEIFAFRYKIICHGHAGPPEKIYNQQAEAIRKAKADGTKYAMANLRTQLRALLAEKADDEQFREDLRRLSYANSAQRPSLKEFLGLLEDHYPWWNKTGKSHPNSKPRPKDNARIYDFTQMTLEHIYPQKAPEAERVADVEPLKHSLGNLSFFGKKQNNDAGGKSFEKKRVSDYPTCDVQMTAELAQHQTWGVAEIDAREQHLLDMAVRVFDF